MLIGCLSFDVCYKQKILSRIGKRIPHKIELGVSTLNPKQYGFFGCGMEPLTYVDWMFEFWRVLQTRILSRIGKGIPHKIEQGVATLNPKQYGFSGAAWTFNVCCLDVGVLIPKILSRIGKGFHTKNVVVATCSFVRWNCGQLHLQRVRWSCFYGRRFFSGQGTFQTWDLGSLVPGGNGAGARQQTAQGVGFPVVAANWRLPRPMSPHWVCQWVLCSRSRCIVSTNGWTLAGKLVPRLVWYVIL